jgi:hypothetical protein
VPLAHRLCDHAHALAVALDLRQHVAAVHGHVLVAAQRRMQGGPVLGHVDALAREQPLDGRRDAAVAREVFEIEPVRPDNPLIGLSNCILTAHVAGVASDTTARIWDWAHDNIRAVVQRGERPRWIRNGV